MPTTSLTLDPPRPTLFTPRQIFLATLIGTELAGAVLLSATVRRVEVPEAAYDAWVRAGALFLLRGVAIYAVPASGLLLTVFAAVHYHRFAKGMLDRTVEAHRDAGGRIESTWTAAGCGLAFLLGALLLALVVG